MKKNQDLSSPSSIVAFFLHWRKENIVNWKQIQFLKRTPPVDLDYGGLLVFTQLLGGH